MAGVNTHLRTSNHQHILWVDHIFLSCLNSWELRRQPLVDNVRRREPDACRSSHPLRGPTRGHLLLFGVANSSLLALTVRALGLGNGMAEHLGGHCLGFDILARFCLPLLLNIVRAELGVEFADAFLEAYMVISLLVEIVSELIEREDPLDVGVDEVVLPTHPLVDQVLKFLHLYLNDDLIDRLLLVVALLHRGVIGPGALLPEERSSLLHVERVL
eukprot:CAMPEP_0170498826 /NCGR_PEP_ID=MMETSP0208-20121228/29108_1 /TAXON_ID=197538 /ORGANISM="Strombidium inclinatum, Strain S3" /LENGTH=215 /DNA_ID=CAMNT_0010776123 /DNA_START=1145 /DNA_END=1792 /DNA_ORIENTATION=+